MKEARCRQLRNLPLLAPYILSPLLLARPRTRVSLLRPPPFAPSSSIFPPSLFSLPSPSPSLLPFRPRLPSSSLFLSSYPSSFPSSSSFHRWSPRSLLCSRFSPRHPTCLGVTVTFCKRLRTLLNQTVPTSA